MAKLLHAAIWRISTQSFIYRINCLLDIEVLRSREFDIKQLAFIILLVLKGAVSTS